MAQTDIQINPPGIQFDAPLGVPAVLVPNATQLISTPKLATGAASLNLSVVGSASGPTSVIVNPA